MTEWRPIPGFPDYEASDSGHIRSWRNQRKNRRVEPLILKSALLSTGYLALQLGLDDSKPIPRKVHHLIAETFIGPRPPGLDVCHNNGNRLDNRAANLRYDTRRGNFSDMVKHGTRPIGENKPNALLTMEKARQIRTAYAEGGISQETLGTLYSVTRGCIRDVLGHKTWKEAA